MLNSLQIDNAIKYQDDLYSETKIRAIDDSILKQGNIKKWKTRHNCINKGR